MTLWEERAGRNQALFREVNEHVQDLHERHLADEQTSNFICECADDACTERIAVPLSTYEQVRSHARRFIIHPGHQDPDIEQVVEVADRFLVVEKVGTAGRVAAANDPRQ